MERENINLKSNLGIVKFPLIEWEFPHKIQEIYCNPPQVARLQPMFSLLSATYRYNFEYKLNWRYLF